MVAREAGCEEVVSLEDKKELAGEAGRSGLSTPGPEPD